MREYELCAGSGGRVGGRVGGREGRGMGVGASRRRWGLGGVLTAGAPRPAAALQFPHIVEVPVSHLEGTRQILQQLGATKEEVGGWVGPGG